MTDPTHPTPDWRDLLGDDGDRKHIECTHGAATITRLATGQRWHVADAYDLAGYIDCQLEVAADDLETGDLLACELPPRDARIEVTGLDALDVPWQWVDDWQDQSRDMTGRVDSAQTALIPEGTRGTTPARE